jgi:hypothetical protein
MPGTFRDPSGSLFDVDGRILRVIRGTDAAAFRALLKSEVVQSLVAKGALVGTRSIGAADVPERLRTLPGDWFEHDRIGFVSVPAEWSAAMLAHAALHTLDVNDELLRHGYLLKDATPANILFEGARPVFVDVPSIEPVQAGQNLPRCRLPDPVVVGGSGQGPFARATRKDVRPATLAERRQDPARRARCSARRNGCGGQEHRRGCGRRREG